MNNPRDLITPPAPMPLWGPLGPYRHYPVDRDGMTICASCGKELKDVADIKERCEGKP